MKSYKISQSYDFAYDIPGLRRHRSHLSLRYPIKFSYASSYLPGPVQMRSGDGSKAPDPVQMRPGSNQMQTLLVPYVRLSSSASKSGCSGLLIHISIAATGSATPLPPSPASGAYSSAYSLASSPEGHDGRTSARRNTTPQAYAGDTRCTPRRTQASGT